jgi:hypothetical protein
VGTEPVEDPHQDVLEWLEDVSEGDHRNSLCCST